MTTIKLTVNRKNDKGKYLLALIKEIAKSDNDIFVEEIDEPNSETQKAMRNAEKGKITIAASVDELFDSI